MKPRAETRSDEWSRTCRIERMLVLWTRVFAPRMRKWTPTMSFLQKS
jgi:hypothetical protein